MNMETTRCGKCGTLLTEDENLQHDGYMGSSYAHNGRGSYGLGRHHYFFACPNCGWHEGETAAQTDARRRRERASYAAKQRGNWSNRVLPPGITNRDETVTLSCSSRQTKTEKVAAQIAYERGLTGGVTHHSLAASYRYVIVPRYIFELAAGLVAKGFAGKDSWEAYTEAARQEVYNCDNH